MRGLWETRGLFGLVAIGLCLVLLAGCGGDDGEADPAATGEETASGEEAPEARAPEAPPGLSEEPGEAPGEPRRDLPEGDPVPGATGPAPAVPVSRHGDNSIQLWGREGTHAQRRAAEEGLVSFLEARATGDRERVCRHVSEKLIGDLRGQMAPVVGPDADCLDLLEIAMGEGDPEILERDTEVDVLSFRIDAEGQAFIIYRDWRDQILAIPMNRDGERWRVSLLGPTPIA